MSSFSDVDALRASIRQAGRSFIEYVSPLQTYSKRGLAGWPLMELDAALAVAGVYVIIVLVGLILYKKPTISIEDKKTKKAIVPLGEKFSKEPILYFQFLYNWLQVGLCGYMVYESINVARTRGYSIVCNPFDGTRKELGPVLWLFYVSKVRCAARAGTTTLGRGPASALTRPPLSSSVSLRAGARFF
jgi:hypothetical protein